TVVDQVRPWLMPRSTFAANTHVQDGAHINRNGTGSAISQPATSTFLRLAPSESPPARELVIALLTPKATMNDSTAERADSPSSSTAIAGRMLRSMPIMAPTQPLTRTRRANWPRFSRMPRRIEAGGAATDQPDAAPPRLTRRTSSIPGGRAMG